MRGCRTVDVCAAKEIGETGMASSAGSIAVVVGCGSGGGGSGVGPSGVVDGAIRQRDFGDAAWGGVRAHEPGERSVFGTGDLVASAVRERLDGNGSGPAG